MISVGTVVAIFFLIVFVLALPALLRTLVEGVRTGSISGRFGVYHRNSVAYWYVMVVLFVVVLVGIVLAAWFVLAASNELALN